MLSKNDLSVWAEKEFATTLKMLKAYPHDKGEYKPSENSRTARDIARTFVFELYLLEAYVLGDTIDRTRFKTYDPEISVLTTDFENQSKQFLHRLKGVTDEDMKKIVDFGGHNFSADKFAFMMILDQIHHRGQLSIYVRLAGGKIPSVYGPSADDPTTNL